MFKKTRLPMIKRILTFIVSQSFYRGREHEFWKLFKIILIANTFVLLILSQTAVFAANIYVPDDYSTIQAAVDASSPDDTIIIRDGTYIENVEIYKNLTIKSESGAGKTIVQAANSEYHVFEVIADYVNISGLTIMGAMGRIGNIAGINICQFNHCIISDNNISENSYGIILRYSNDNTITKNNIGWSRYYGIFLIVSNNNIVMKNNISTYQSDKISLPSFGSSVGLFLGRSSDNIIYLNNFKNPVKNSRCDSSETNIWNSPSKITYTYKGKTYTKNLGNYWEDYKGIDANVDIIGDTPYIIKSLNKDRRPLMQSFKNYIEGGVSPEKEKISLHYSVSQFIPESSTGTAFFLPVIESVEYQAYFPWVASYIDTAWSIILPITFYVTNSENVPISGAQIFMGQQKLGLTDSNGEFTYKYVVRIPNRENKLVNLPFSAKKNETSSSINIDFSWSVLQTTSIDIATNKDYEKYKEVLYKYEYFKPNIPLPKDFFLLKPFLPLLKTVYDLKKGPKIGDQIDIFLIEHRIVGKEPAAWAYWEQIKRGKDIFYFATGWIISPEDKQRILDTYFLIKKA